MDDLVSLYPLERISGGVWRRRLDDWRHHHQPQCHVLDHDHGNPAVYALPGERGDARGGLGNLR